MASTTSPSLLGAIDMLRETEGFSLGEYRAVPIAEGWGDADWREYVKALYEAHPNDIGIGTEPAICTSGWFGR